MAKAMIDKREEMQRLPPVQTKAIALLMSGRSVTAVARELKTNPATVHRWLNDPDFDGALKTEQAARMMDSRRQFRALTAKALQGAGAAIRRLRAILADKTVPAAVHVQAAAQLLAASFRLHETGDVSERLEQLEAMAAKQQEQRT